MLLTSLNKIPFSIRSTGFVAASMLEAQSLRTDAGVKSEKKRRSMFSGLKGFESEGTFLSNRNRKMNQNVSGTTYELSKDSKSHLFSVVTKVRGCKYLSKQTVTFKPDGHIFLKVILN